MPSDWVIRSHVFRSICIPFIQIARRWRTKKYIQSEDAQYIRNMKNQYEDKTCFIIGNGPSLRAEDLTKLKGQFTIAFNRIFDIYPNTDWRPTVYMSVDTLILDSLKREDLTRIGAKMLFVANPDLAKKWKRYCNIHYINRYGKNRIKKEQLVMERINEDVSKYFTISQSVITSAFELAFYLGFKKIYLLGVDHNFPTEVSMNGKRTSNQDIKNFHFSLNADQSNYVVPKEAMTKCFEVCRDYAEEHGVKIYNATRGGKLEVFERVDFDELLKEPYEREKSNESVQACCDDTRKVGFKADS